MASKMTTKDFFATANSVQFDFALANYDKALRLKAEAKSSKPENVIKLDKWYQNELPKKIKSRGKDAHLVHDELVQTIKWKLARGKFRPNLTNLVQMNTPRVVMQDTKKAFRKLHKTGDLQGACNALCNLKGVGPAMASAVLAAGAPHAAPFMADECLLAMPEVDGLDYTMKEYMRFVEYVNACVERLNSQGDSKWTPHKVELAVWTHYILRDLSPELLSDMPEADAAAPLVSQNTPSNNGQLDEDTKSSMASSVDAEDDLSNSAAAKNIPHSEETSESMPSGSETEVKNGNGEATATTEQAPKTNGNNSHNNGSEEKNGGAKAGENDEKKQSNGELENGINSSEKESTDLSSSSPSAVKRPPPTESADDQTEVTSEVVEPASKKIKTCEDAAKTSEQEQPAPAPEVATV